MSDLMEFLLARLGEDEQVARAAAPGPWEYQDIDSVGGGRICDPEVAIADVDWDNEPVDPRIRRFRPAEQADATGEHIVRHHPARVLREVEAKRHIVREHHEQDPTAEWCPTCDGQLVPCQTLLHIASIYADHGDYRPEWASE